MATPQARPRWHQPYIVLCVNKLPSWPLSGVKIISKWSFGDLDYQEQGYMRLPKRLQVALLINGNKCKTQLH